MSSSETKRPSALKLIISAPSGGGKTSLIRSLLDKDKGIKSVCSHTTRDRRMTEKEGVDYWFVTRETFRAMQDNNELIEYNENYGEMYGTSVREVEKAINENRDVLFEVDWNGAQAIRKMLKDTKWIFLIPPNIQVLCRRLRGRGRDSDQEIQTRLTNALFEIRQGLELAEYLVINDNFDCALEQVRSIITAERCRNARVVWHNREIIKKMFAQGEQTTTDA